MLIDSISNPWVRFKVLQREGEKSQIAKRAFLYVIANYNARDFRKEKALGEIVGACPNIIEAVSDEEIFEHFLSFYKEMFEKKEIISPTEISWVNKYVRNAETRTQIEHLIYHQLLEASSYWDKTRREFNWTIPESDKTELAREALRDENLGSKRKMQLAQEFREPDERFVSAYHKKLLCDKHYDLVDAWEVNNPDLIIDVIIFNIDNGRFGDALYVAKRFLPDRKDIIKEVQQIITILRN